MNIELMRTTGKKIIEVLTASGLKSEEQIRIIESLRFGIINDVLEKKGV